MKLPAYLPLGLAFAMCCGCLHIDNGVVEVSSVDRDHVCINGRAFPLRTNRDGFEVRYAYRRAS